MRWHLTSVVRSWSKANLNGMLYLTRQEENYTGHALLEYSTYIKHFLKRKKKQPNKKTNENVLKREKAVPHFLMNLRFIHLNQRFYYKASVTCHSQLSAYSKGNTHSTSHCKHVEQCHIWGNKTRAAYMLVWFCTNKRNHL